MKRVLTVIVATTAVVAAGCGRGGATDGPEAAVRAASAEPGSRASQRDLPRPAPGYYLQVKVTLSSAETDAIALRVFGTVYPMAGRAPEERPPGQDRFEAELDAAEFELARSYADEAKTAGFGDVVVAANPGGRSGCALDFCAEAAPAEGYVVVLAGPFDGPQPPEYGDPPDAHVRQLNAQVDFQHSKTAELFPPAVAARAPRLASLPLPPGVYWLYFSSS